MRNPWQCHAVTDGFVLGADRPTVDAFNRQARPATRLHLDLVPEPFLGNPQGARVLILQQNPGFSVADPQWHTDPGYSGAAWENLHQEPAEYPLYLLDPRWERSPGGQWHRKRLRALSVALQDPEFAQIARGLMVVEFHGYHSEQYERIPVTLPSQSYNFELVRCAIEAGNVVVVARGSREWNIAVPELENYERAFALTNPRSPYITPKSLGKDSLGQRRFEAIVDLIASA